MNHNTASAASAGIPQNYSSVNSHDGQRERTAVEPHWRISAAQARSLFDMGVFNAATYLLAIIKCHGAAGWKWSFKVSDFCKDYGFQPRTFTWALSKLRAKHLVFWEGADRLTVWWQEIGIAKNNTTSSQDSQGADLTLNGSNADGSMARQDLAESKQDLADGKQDLADEKPEPTENKGFRALSILAPDLSSDFYSTPPHPRPPHPRRGGAKFEKKEKKMKKVARLVVLGGLR